MSRALFTDVSSARYSDSSCQYNRIFGRATSTGCRACAVFELTSVHGPSVMPPLFVGPYALGMSTMIVNCGCCTRFSRTLLVPATTAAAQQ